MISRTLILTILLVLTGFINLVLSMYLLRYKDTRASKLLSLTLLCAAAWAFFHALEFYAPTELFTVRNKLKYLGIMPLPPFLLAFSFEYTGRKNWVTFRKIAILFIIPAVNLFLLWTGLFQELSSEINSLNGEVYFIETWPFLLHSVYSYLLLASAAALILYQLSRLHKSYRKHALILTLGILVPFAGNVVNLMGINPFPGKFDITPALFTISAIALTWGVSSFSFLDVIPVARNSVFENTKDAVMVLDGRNNLVDFNKAARELGEKGYIPKLSGDPWNTNLDEIFRKKAWLSEVEDDGSGKTVQLKGIEGERWYDVQVSPIYGEGREPNAKIVTLRNVSERKVREKIEFLHSLLRHDVRNKSQLTLGYLELLKECDLPNEGERYLNKAADVTQDGIDLIEKVRTLRELGEEEELKQIAVNMVIKDIISEAESQAEEKGIEIQYEVIDCKVSGGPLLEELFSNLVENSIIHSGCREIKISSRETEEECIVTIEDDGKGLTDEEKEKIFERGFKKGENAGTGLGLYMVNEIAENYGGNVEVKDSELGGARFDVKLILED